MKKIHKIIDVVSGLALLVLVAVVAKYFDTGEE